MDERVDVWSFLLGLATISLTILVHEFGHYLIACWRGVKVNRFSLFFGPILWQRTWKETSFCLSLIPFGGYCQMERDGQKGLYNKDWLSKCLVSLAGPLANVVIGFLLLLLLFFHATPVYDTQVVVLQESFGDNPFYDAGLRSGDKILQINSNKLNSFAQLQQMLDNLELAESVILVYEREGKSAEIEINLSQPLSEKVLIPWSETLLDIVAEKLHTKFQSSERLISVDAQRVNTTADLASLTVKDNVLCVVEQSDGSRREVELSKEEWQILLKESRFISEIKKPSLIRAWLQSTQFFLQFVKLFFKIFVDLFKGSLAVSNVFAGPLQTAQLIGQDTTSFKNFMQKFSLLNFILAMSNLIPLAGLDGGTLFFHTFELLLPQKRRNRARQFYGLLSSFIIICLFIFIFSLDLMSFSRKS